MAKRRGVKATKQRQEWDCGLAALTSLLPLEYADVSAMARTLFDMKQVKRDGLLVRQMEELGTALGFTLKRIRKSKHYLEGRTGVLAFNYAGKRDKEGHWAVIKDGTHIVDPDGAEIWNVADYLKHKQYTTGTLFVIED